MQKQSKKVYLDIHHAFGSNFAKDSQNSIGVVEEEGKFKVVYLVGKTIAKQAIVGGAMEFISLSENTESVECMAISPTCDYAVICEKLKGESFLLLNLYGLKTVDPQIKHFKLPRTDKQSSLKIITFSPSQPKFACCMTAEPQCQLMFLDIWRSRGLAVSSFSVQGTESIGICPTQSHVISCAGRNIFKMFKVEDYVFKPYQDIKKLPKSRNFSSHVWFDKTKILIGTDRGELFMVGPVGNNFEVKRHLTNVFGDIGHECAITSLYAFTRGFIIASEEGHFSLWLKNQENQDNFQDQYTGDLVRRWQMKAQRVAPVISLAMCTNQERIAIGFANCSVAVTTLSSILSTEQLSQDGKTIEHEFLTFLYQGNNRSQISALQTCLHRPIFIILCKKENTIQVWNYKQPSCQLVKKFDAKLDGIQDNNGDLLNCVALHPMGYYMAVGCCDKLRIYHILVSQLRNFRQIVLRGVCQLKFSHGGQLLAAAYPRQKVNVNKYNIHLINIYNSYTLEQIGRLSDHSNIVMDIVWKHDDRMLFTTGMDGTVNQWRKGLGKDWECRKWTQTARYCSMVEERISKSLLVAGLEANKPIVREFKLEKDQSQKVYAVGFKVCKLAWLNSQWNVAAVLAGSEAGCLKVFNARFDNIVQQRMNVHLKQVVGIVTSPCGRYVISAGKDGTVFIYVVSLVNCQGALRRKYQQQDEFEMNPLIGVLDDGLAEVVLVQRDQLTQKVRYANLLQKNAEQLRRKLMAQDDEQSRKLQKQVQELVESKDTIIEGWKKQFQRLKQQQKMLEMTSQAKYAQISTRNKKMLQDIQILFEKKLAMQSQKYYSLELSYAQSQTEQQHEKEEAQKKVDDTIQLLKKEFVECFRKAEKIHDGEQQAMIEGQKEFNEKISQLEQEHQQELSKVSESIKQLQDNLSSKSAEYVTSIQSLKRECRIASEQIVRNMSQNEQMQHEQQLLRKQLININNSIVQQRELLAQRQEILRTREQKIGECQQRISDLQKKKEVLSYRTWEMRQQIQPKEDEIEFLKNEIFQLEKQFELLLSEEKIMQDGETRLRVQKEQLRVQLSRQKLQSKDRKDKIKKISDDINRIIQSKVSDRKSYELQMRQLYERYSAWLSQSKRMKQNQRGMDEMQRHKVHIDEEITLLRRETDMRAKKRDQEIQRTTLENAELIQEVSEFREERGRLTTQLKNVQKVAEGLKRQIAQIKMVMAQKPVENATESKPKSRLVVEPMPMIRAASQPSFKGKIARGINYDAGNLSIFSKAKIKDLESKLQKCKLVLRQKQTICSILKEKISQHLSSSTCQDAVLSRSVAEFEE